MRIVILLAGLITVLSLQAQDTVELSVVSRVGHAPLDEISGIVKSRDHDNLYWVHNDSGDRARIFAIDGEGRNIIPTYSRFSFHGARVEAGKSPWQGFSVLFAENVDWEDMTADENFLYIADTGNNGNDRQDLGIYMISEIDPTASTQSASIRHMPLRYPEQQSFPASVWHFDSESLFHADGKLYLLTKHRRPGQASNWEPGTNLYRLDTDYTDRDNLLTLVGSHPGITAATGAEVSPNGQLLAVISYTALWIFERPESGDDWLAAPFTRIGLNPDKVRQLEAVSWEDDDSLIMINEQRDIFRLSLSDTQGDG